MSDGCLCAEAEFRKVEEHFAAMCTEGKSRGCAVEERVLSYQKQLEDRARTEVTLQVSAHGQRGLTWVCMYQSMYERSLYEGSIYKRSMFE